jgi:hypothetical protein
VRYEFDLSASHNLIPPSSPRLLSVMSKHKMRRTMLLHSRLSEVRDVFDFSASDSSVAPAAPMPLAVLRENLLSKSVTFEIE